MLRHYLTGSDTRLRVPKRVAKRTCSLGIVRRSFGKRVKSRRRASLDGGELRPQAEVNAAAERQVAMGIAVDVELLWVVERSRIAIGCRQQRKHHLSAADSPAVEICILTRLAPLGFQASCFGFRAQPAV